MRSVLITVRDIPALVKAQGGGAAALVNRIVPDTIEETVYDKMVADITGAMKQKGVDADVKVVSPMGYQPARSSCFLVGALVGVGATIALGLLAHFVGRRK
jgi:hypothetical protein